MSDPTLEEYKQGLVHKTALSEDAELRPIGTAMKSDTLTEQVLEDALAELMKANRCGVRVVRLRCGCIGEVSYDPNCKPKITIRML